MAIVEGYVVARVKGFMPYIEPLNTFAAGIKGGRYAEKRRIAVPDREHPDPQHADIECPDPHHSSAEFGR